MFELDINDMYVVSCKPKWHRDPVISNMESIAVLLHYLDDTDAPINIISELFDLAVELDVTVKEKE